MIITGILWFASVSGTSKTVRELYPSYQIFCKQAMLVEKITGIAGRYVYASSGFDQGIVDRIDKELPMLEQAGDSLQQCVFKKAEVRKRSLAISDSLIFSCRAIRESLNDAVNHRISKELYLVQYDRSIATIASTEDSIITFFETPLRNLKRAPYLSREAQITFRQMNSNGLIADLFSGRYLDR